MNIGREGLAASVLALGYALAGAFYWALLNVPESNALALVLSALLVLSIVVTGAATTAGAIVLGRGTAPEDGHHLGAAIGGFVLGLAIFAALCAMTGETDAWWGAHRGEIDALFLRYGGSTRTGWLHQSESWLSFLLRWALGLSVIAALAAAGARSGTRGLPHGLRAAVRLAPLAATIAGVLIVSEVVWRLAYWRPRRLPPTWMEPAFVAIKLAVLYGLAIAIAAGVLSVHRRVFHQPTRSSG